MAYVHFTETERARISALKTQHDITEYAVLRKIFTLGFQRLEAGEKLFGTAPMTPAEEVGKRLENRLNLILEKLYDARARDFNMALELLEHTVWLRILGEHFRPGDQDQVDDRVKKGALLIFKNMHLPPAAARAAK